MLKEVGRVVAVEGQSIWVETIQRSTCNSCAAQKGCGYGLLNETAHQRRNHLELSAQHAPPEGFKVNDVVQLEFPEQELVKGALAIYLLPLLTMLLLAALASEYFASSVYVAIAAALGLTMGLLLVSRYTKGQVLNVEAKPVITPPTAALSQCIKLPE